MEGSPPLGSEGVPHRPWIATCSTSRSHIIDEAFDSFSARVSFMGTWSRQRSMANKALSHTLTDIFLATLITASILMVVVETNYAADDENDLPTWMSALSAAILMIFCSEVGLRFYVERKHFLQNYWNVFDALVVFTDLVASLLRWAFDLDSGNFPVIAFRLVRIMKMTRAVRLLSVFPELNTMLQCLACAVKTVIWAILMLAVVLGFWGIFAVLFIHPLNVELTKTGYWQASGCERCPRAFASVQQSMLTFAQQAVAGDSWGQVTVPLIEHYPATGFFFFGVLASVSFAVMNLILAAIVERAAEVNSISMKEEALKKDQDFRRASDDLFRICHQLDADGSGSLTFQELWEGFKSNPDFASIMASMDIGESDLEVVFHILDSDGSQSIDYKEFVDQLHMMKSCNTQTLLVFIKFYVMELRSSMHILTKQGAPMSSPWSRHCSPSSQAGLPSDASALAAAAAPPHPQAQAKQTGGSSWCDTAGVVTATLKETMNLLDMQQELSEVLRRQEEACKDRIRHLEAIVSPLLRAEASAEPCSADAGSPGQQAARALGETCREGPTGWQASSAPDGTAAPGDVEPPDQPGSRLQL